MTTDLQGGNKGTKKESEGGVRGDTCPAHQIRIGPVTLQGCGDFANDQVIHLLGGFWIVSAEAKHRVLLLTIGYAPSSHLKEPKEEEIDV